MAGGEVAAVLLKEAQQEIALLRTDLFNTRRLAEERRQAVDALQAERERLARHCDDVEASLRAANTQLNHVPELQHRCTQLEASLRKMQSELETSIAARRILEQELDDERRQRAAIAEQKALLEGDRARIAKQRDDLATQLRIQQNKAREAEEEQVRAEEDAAALRAEVVALQQTAAAAATSSSNHAHPTSAHTSTLTHTSSADTAAAIAAAIAAATTPLLEQFEHERNRAATLLSSLHAAKSEIMELSQRLADYEARHTDMLARGHQDPELLAHQIAQLRNHNHELTCQLEAAADRSRELEAEAAQLRSAVAKATEEAAAAVVAAAAATAAAQQSGASQRASQQQLDLQDPSGGSDMQPSVASRFLSLAGRITSSGSLYGGTAGSEAGCGRDTPAAGDQAGGGEDLARLRQQVLRLKASRDKLLAEIDKQWEEIERLGSENAVLADELRTARALAANWERQAQDGIAQVAQLKDLLEDSASWGTGAAAAPTSGADPRVGANAGAEATATAMAAAAPTVQSLQVELLGEKARAAELELQLRAVAAELLRCQHASLDLGKSFLPMMAGVEKRLGELCRKARSN